MQDYSIVFTPGDYEILESYKILVDGLADYLGEGYELVLHSLADLDKSVVKIINGHHTGRKEGSPITDLALSMLAEIKKKSNPNYVSYFNQNKKGEPLKATTIAIKGTGDKIIGLLCINLYLNTPFSEFLNNFFPLNQKCPSNDVMENYVENVEDLIKGALNEVKGSVYNDISIPAANKNKEIINQLYNRGIFNLKDAVIKVADLLGISKNTVYMHMRNFKD